MINTEEHCERSLKREERESTHGAKVRDVPSGLSGREEVEVLLQNRLRQRKPHLDLITKNENIISANKCKQDGGRRYLRDGVRYSGELESHARHHSKTSA